MASKTPNGMPEPTHGMDRSSKVSAGSQASTGSTTVLGGEDEGGGSDDDGGGGDHVERDSHDVLSTPAKAKSKKRPRKKKKAIVQTEPPSVLISKLFPGSTYPRGEEIEYTDDNLNRVTNEERRSWDKVNHEFLADYRQAAETHRQVRQWAQKAIKPGQSLTEIANNIEDSVRLLVGHDGLTEGDAIVAGMGFPTGLNIDHVAAHYSPNEGCKVMLQHDSVLKVDFGVHVSGRIVDSAFTLAFDPKYDNLLTAVKDSTNTGVREAGVGVRLGELGGYIQETMESYECELNGTTYPIKPIRSLAGHTILPYSIHGTKSVPLVKTDDMTKMEEGDVFAIETFGTTGSGYVVEQGECSHYALLRNAPRVDLSAGSAKSILNVIKKNFGTMPFCRRYLDRIGQAKYLFGLNQLVKAGIVDDYPPLVDKKGSFTAQFEHTILLKPYSKEIISRGDDY